MKTFLVGGAVRDELLGLPVKDRDWVVTGATPKDMTKAGFRPVGQDFPVFLHPKTKEEYALARTERKSGHGYAGFVFHTSPDISVEEDLLRRDLTINAMAKDEQGHIIDPYHGQQDLEQRLLRHVSPAFREDPLRILRVARFAARFAAQGFTVADDTMALMQAMVAEGEADWLIAERVWQETSRALESRNPEIYFSTLYQANALHVVMPEIAPLFAPSDAMPYQALHCAATNNHSAVVRFACAVSSFEENSNQQVTLLCQRMKIPVQFKEVAQIVSKILPFWQGESISPAQRLALLQQTDGFRRPERFGEILDACTVISQTAGLSHPLSTRLRNDLKKCKTIDVQALIKQGHKGKELAEALNRARLERLQ